eukprot:9057391-Lingulodinium_polyedra.AAC.1
MSMSFMTLFRNSDPLSVWNRTISCSPIRAFSSAMIEFRALSVSSAHLAVGPLTKSRFFAPGPALYTATMKYLSFVP